MFTPASEVDGREKQVDNFRRAAEAGQPAPSMVYWGKYVQHDNNRDGIGVGLAAHAEHAEDVPRLAPAPSCTTCTSR